MAHVWLLRVGGGVRAILRGPRRCTSGTLPVCVVRGGTAAAVEYSDRMAHHRVLHRTRRHSRSYAADPQPIDPVRVHRIVVDIQCSLRIGFVNTVLSWQVWVPLSRVTFCAYLLHLFCIKYFYYKLEFPLVLTGLNVVSIFEKISIPPNMCEDCTEYVRVSNFCLMV